MRGPAPTLSEQNATKRSRNEGITWLRRRSSSRRKGGGVMSPVVHVFRKQAFWSRAIPLVTLVALGACGKTQPDAAPSDSGTQSDAGASDAPVSDGSSAGDATADGTPTPDVDA